MEYTIAQAHQPAVISSMKRLEDEYKLLVRRRSTLQSEIRNDSEHSKSLKELRKSELKRLSAHLAKIENFLKRYGFIENERTVYNGSLNYSAQ